MWELATVEGQLRLHGETLSLKNSTFPKLLEMLSLLYTYQYLITFSKFFEVKWLDPIIYAIYASPCL